MYLGPDEHGIEPEFEIVDTEEIAQTELSAMSDDARRDAAAGNWDEVMTDRILTRIPQDLSRDEVHEALSKIKSRIEELA